MDEMETLQSVNYMKIVNHAAKIDRERKYALMNGDFSKYIEKTLEGGFEIEQEVIDSNFVEYYDYLKSIEKKETKYTSGEGKLDGLKRILEESIHENKR